jgi:hypothetical protein
VGYEKAKLEAVASLLRLARSLRFEFLYRTSFSNYTLSLQFFTIGSEFQMQSGCSFNQGSFGLWKRINKDFDLFGLVLEALEWIED